MILTVRTTVGREKTVLDSLQVKISSLGDGIKAVLSPAEIKGYIFVEGDSKEIHNVRGIIEKEIDPEVIQQLFDKKTEEIKLEIGDLVEVVGGPFKKEKARITRIIEQKKEAKIELVDAMVPIPITIKLELLKRIKS